MVNDAGVTEELTADKLRFTNGGRELRVFGLSATAGSARLVATLSKSVALIPIIPADPGDALSNLNSPVAGELVAVPVSYLLSLIHI